MPDIHTSHVTFDELKPGLCEARVAVGNNLGLHARPAALLAQAAQMFESEVTIAVAGQQADAKSILDILSLSAGLGAILSIRAEGGDAGVAVRTLAGLVLARFQENEDESVPEVGEAL